MYIELRCTGCQKRYRVDASMAGRVVECRQCGQRLTVPGRSAVIKLDENDEQPPAPRAKAKPVPVAVQVAQVEQAEPEDSNLIGLATEAPDSGTAYVPPKQPVIPEIITEIVLPLLLILAAAGTAGYTAVVNAIHSAAPIVGCVFIGLAVGLLVLLIMPLTLRAIESASKTMDYHLPNAVWLQSFAALLAPTTGLTLGWFHGGAKGLLFGGIAGMVGMLVLMCMFYRIGLLKGAITVLFSGMVYLLGGGIVFAVCAMLAVILSMAHHLLPWQEEERVVAKLDRPAMRASAPTTGPTTMSSPTTLPTVAAKPKPAPAKPVVAAAPAKPAPQPVEAAKPPPWVACVDPAPATGKWPGELHHILQVKPPTAVIHSRPAGPFVTLADLDSYDTYDLRSGRRVGFVKQTIQPQNGVLSADGRCIAMVQQMSFGQQSAVEVWSTTESRAMMRIDPAAGVPQIVGFAGNERLVTANGYRLQVWDINTGQPTRELSLGGAPSLAVISLGGRYLAADVGRRISICDLQTGDAVNQLDIFTPTQVVKAMAFSDDGAELAVVTADHTAVPRLAVVNLADGTCANDVALAGGSRPDLAADRVFWTPSRAGLLVENDWIDRTTGRILYTLPPISAGTSVGVLRMMTGDYWGMYEFPPAVRSEKVIFKTVSIPKAKIEPLLPIAAAPATMPAAVEMAVADSPDNNESITTQPAASAETSYAAAEKLSKGLVEFSTGQIQAAQATLNEGIALYGRAVGPKIDDETLINLYHGLAVTHLRMGEIAKARQALDRIRTASKSNRSIRLNDAITDISMRINLLRGVDSIEKLLAAGPVDELTVNLYGYALDKLESDSTTRTQAERRWADYQRYESQLAPPVPGKQRWGSAWIGATEMADIKRQLQQADAAKRNKESEISSTRSQLDSARTDYAEWQTRYKTTRAHNAADSSLSHYSSQANAAAARAQQLENTLGRQRTELNRLPDGPKRPFDPPPKGVDPTTDLE